MTSVTPSKLFTKERETNEESVFGTQKCMQSSNNISKMLQQKNMGMYRAMYKVTNQSTILVERVRVVRKHIS